MFVPIFNTVTNIFKKIDVGNNELFHQWCLSFANAIKEDDSYKVSHLKQTKSLAALKYHSEGMVVAKTNKKSEKYKPKKLKWSEIVERKSGKVVVNEKTIDMSEKNTADDNEDINEKEVSVLQDQEKVMLDYKLTLLKLYF